MVTDSMEMTLLFHRLQKAGISRRSWLLHRHRQLDVYMYIIQATIQVTCSLSS